jgi:oligosaccharide reducing-end xylanase
MAYRSVACRFTFALLVGLTCNLGAQVAPTPSSQPQSTSAYRPPMPQVNAPLGNIPGMPGDGTGAYKTHKYVDLFAEQGHMAAESEAKIEKAFQQLFHGDGQEERLYFETGANEHGPLAYITDWANNDARTEGMSYGMMIAVELNKKGEFDALWNWAKTYMLITDCERGVYGLQHRTGSNVLSRDRAYCATI